MGSYDNYKEIRRGTKFDKIQELDMYRNVFRYIVELQYLMNLV